MRKKFFRIGAAAMFLLTVVFGAAIFPAGANLEEIIREDVSYFNFPEKGKGGARVYVVEPGDTLSSIAAKFKIKAYRISEANKLANVNHIETGQELLIPDETVKHMVQPGETLTEIAASYGAPVEELTKLNRLPNKDMLIAGQELLISTGESAVLPAWNPTIGLPVNEMIWPVAGWISSGFGMREGRPHEGVDIAAQEGDPVRAVRAGVVIFAGERGTYGLTVIVDHGGGLSSLYAHNSAILVEEGQQVEEGQLIARVGATGRSTGPHLHLEVRLKGVPYDPMLCLKRMYA
jgi:murein DD-endopeptidase MepM/ murein hydrolase activator NlpD